MQEKAGCPTTFEEIDNEFGFHDAFMHDLRIDFVNGTAVLHMALDFGDPDGPKREDYRVAKLQVSGLCFCSIDPPHTGGWDAPNRRYMPRGYPLGVGGDSGKPGTRIPLEALSQTPPLGISVYRFFVHDWNSFIIIAAKDVQISWLDGGAPIEE
jgi:hypothetical protein